MTAVKARPLGDPWENHTLSTASYSVREALGIPPVARWQCWGESSLLVDAYLFAGRGEVVLPALPVPFIATQLDGRKVAFKRNGNEDLLYMLPNRCVLIPPGTETRWMPGAGSVTLANAYVGGKGDEAIRRMLQASAKPVVLKDVLIAALIRQVLNLATNQSPAANGCNVRLVDCFVSHLEWLASAPLTPRLARNTSNDAAISQVLLLIDEHVDEPLTIEMLAEKANMSAPLFRRRFTAATGMSVHQYVLKVRIERAGELITGSNLPLVTIATQCGFSSQSHMTKALRRELAVTPAELRRR